MDTKNECGISYAETRDATPRQIVYWIEKTSKCACCDALMATYTKINSDFVCDDCVADNYETCDNCGELVHNDASVFIDSDTLCPGCVSHCKDCGEPVGKDSYVQNHGYICKSCAEEYRICDSCNDLVPDNATYWIESEERMVCGDCVESYYFMCGHCDELTSNDYGIYVEGIGSICETCRDNHYFICESCNGCYHSDMYSSEGECVHCADRVMRDYNYTPNWTRLGIGQGPNRHKIPVMGIELEAGCYDSGKTQETAENLLEHSEDERLFFLKSDSSITADDIRSGIELVTHPATLDYHLTKFPWSDILSTFREHQFLSHDAGTCGIHVHINQEFLTTSEKVKVGLFVHALSDFLPKLARRGRNGYCKFKSVKKGLREEPLRYISNNRDRYEAVNFQNSQTIEFRLWRGSLLLPTVLSTIELSELICRFVKTISSARIMDSKKTWKQFIDFCKYEAHPKGQLLTYLNNRGL